MSPEVLPGSIPIPSCFLWSFSLHALYLVGERADRCKMGTARGEDVGGGVGSSHSTEKRECRQSQPSGAYRPGFESASVTPWLCGTVCHPPLLGFRVQTSLPPSGKT